MPLYPQTVFRKVDSADPSESKKISIYSTRRDMSQLSYPLPRETFQFLQALTRNNDREWFNAERQVYQNQVVTPISRLIDRLRPVLQRLEPKLDVSYRVNTTVMRINRDRRFHPEAAPYRTYIKVSFPIQGRKWSDDPVLGFGVFPEYFYVAFRNAGQKRRSFIQRYSQNLKAHREIVERWLVDCQVPKTLQFLGGEHDDIAVISNCSSRWEDWSTLSEPTVGYIWSGSPIERIEAIPFEEVVDRLIRLYFLKLLALSDDVATDSLTYFSRVRELCV
ncbi:MAG: DUF2461 family protein [Microcystis sp. M015S2]|uniref:DUF2461 family protein n=2 Tax=Microcystis TaxID=1125 RepID=UPI0025900759|nr:DUF2461 family protein [Microcystis sp. M025S2]MCA2711295.1 DUF2461 family protein [Microcystis sp. M025S2]MCA2743592.1 DUF2461 family protein [Microcystis sp. M015S2]MCA2757713.1 DUF2461 family protein [Microcystis sp. M145S2]